MALKYVGIFPTQACMLLIPFGGLSVTPVTLPSLKLLRNIAHSWCCQGIRQKGTVIYNLFIFLFCFMFHWHESVDDGFRNQQGIWQTQVFWLWSFLSKLKLISDWTLQRCMSDFFSDIYFSSSVMLCDRLLPVQHEK